MDRIEATYRTDRKSHSMKPRVSFSAIVAGVVVALATLVLLGFLGIAIGGAPGPSPRPRRASCRACPTDEAPGRPR